MSKDVCVVEIDVGALKLCWFPKVISVVDKNHVGAEQVVLIC